MKKLLAIAVSVAALNASAASWTGASSYRESLGDVYTDLGCVAGTSCFNDGVTTNGTAANEYAELLYRIDNLDDTISVVTLSTDASGKLIAIGGGPNGGFSLAEVLVQVETFVDAVEEDLFGDRDYRESRSDGWSHGDADSNGNITGHTNNTGLATVRLGRIVDAVNKTNQVLSSGTKTKAEKLEAVEWFYSGTATTQITGGPSGWEGFGEKDGSSGEAIDFNNAVDALASISSGLGSFTTEAHFTNAWILDGVADTTYSATGYSDTGRNIEDGNWIYDSYADYVTESDPDYATSSQSSIIGLSVATSIDDFPNAWSLETATKGPRRWQYTVTTQDGTEVNYISCNGSAAQCNGAVDTSYHGLSNTTPFRYNGSTYATEQAVINAIMNDHPA